MVVYCSLIYLSWNWQLYVSVDAATKERLKAIDRPLFADFWERFNVRIQTDIVISSRAALSVRYVLFYVLCLNMFPTK